MNTAQRIDTHQHVIPPRYAKWMKAKGVRPGGIAMPEWSRLDALHFMDTHDIATGVLSLSTPGVNFGSAPEARQWAREINEYCAELVAEMPDRFGFFATLTLPDVEGAIDEARYAFDVLHADGIVLLANNEGRYLGDPAFEPLLAYLDGREALVFVHPGELPGPAVPGIPSFTADFLLDTTRTAVSLILSGAMRKYPKIKFILAHAGGFVPFIAYRILLTLVNAKSKPGQARFLLDQERQTPGQLAVLRRFYYDIALSSTPAALPSLFEVADPSHITYGSDFPYAPAPAVSFMARQYEKYPMEPAMRHAIDRGNAEALMPRLKS